MCFFVMLAFIKPSTVMQMRLKEKFGKTEQRGKKEFAPSVNKGDRLLEHTANSIIYCTFSVLVPSLGRLGGCL